MHKLLRAPLLTLLVAVAACSVKERTEPVSPIFLEGAPIEQAIPELPFQHSWIDPSVRQKGYRSIFIKPIRTDLIPPDTWKRSRGIAVGSKETFDNDAAVLARYFKIRLSSELRELEKPRFTVVEAPTNDSIILEIAITELVLSEPLIRAAALAAPLPGVDLALTAISDPHVSFAARFYAPDGKTLIATAADRRFPPLRIIDLNKLRARSSAREIIAQWAKELALSIQSDRMSKVERSSSFSILPW
ncbi:MAG: DUF3313 family protein [Pseudomonadota bacterium]|jgi:hypothetical protein